MKFRNVQDGQTRLPPTLWNALDGRLWHATGLSGVAGINADREIRATGHRYKCSLCKRLGGVSLMDFGPTSTDLPGQFNNWVGWMGHQQDCHITVWLEISRDFVDENLLDAAEIRLLANQKHPCSQVIPGVEACHKGAIPIAAIALGLLISRSDRALFQHTAMAATESSVVCFQQRLPPIPEENPTVKALRKARERASRRQTEARIPSY